jgi:hypothetical protein
MTTIDISISIKQLITLKSNIYICLTMWQTAERTYFQSFPTNSNIFRSNIKFWHKYLLRFFIAFFYEPEKYFLLFFKQRLAIKLTQVLISRCKKDSIYVKLFSISSTIFLYFSIELTYCLA